MLDLKEKFILLMWKQWLFTKRRIVKIICEMAYPIIMCLVLIILRPKPEEKNERHFQSFSALEGKGICENSSEMNIVAYSPNSPLFHRILSNICPKVNAVEFETASELNKEIASNANLSQFLLFAVSFNDDLGDLNTPKFLTHLEVTLRLPSETQEHEIEEWYTEFIFPSLEVSGPRSPEATYDAKPNYHSRGFLHLQEAITLGFISDGQTEPLDTNITMQRFPHPEWLEDKFYNQKTTYMLAALISIHFMLRCVLCVQDLTLEKQQHTKESMEAMGFPWWLLWASWFIYNLVPLLIAVIIMAFFLTLPVRETPVLEHSDRYFLMLCFSLVSCSVITFSFLISTLFSKASTASVIGGIFFFIVSGIPYILRNTDSTTSLASCLLVGSAICYGIEVVVKFEAAEEGVHLDNLWMEASPDELTLGKIFVMLIVDALLHLVLAACLDQLIPGEFGAWSVPCWRSDRSKESLHSDSYNEPGSSRLTNANFEDSSKGFPIGIQLENLSKTFGVNKVVKNLNLTIYENQITVLLGHKGAGKTTTLSMIIGMLTPTTGKVQVFGFDIKKYTRKIRDNIGLCLQYNSLFDNMTVSENLHFICKLKGSRADIIHEEIRSYVKILELKDKKVLVKNLSREMKRMLNVAMALCGNTKAIILDEPSAGLDPVGRRKVWDLLRTHKRGRSILLATDLMEEADVLGDRIAIMSNGELQCCGSLPFLKTKFASGYCLTLEVSPNCQSSIITNMLKKHISSVQLQSQIGSELIYKLSQKEMKKYEDLLRDLDYYKRKLEVYSYKISPASLEEVFLKVGAHRNMDSEREIEPEKYVASGNFILNQFLAMCVKKVPGIRRAWLLLVFTQVVLPVVLIVCFLLSVSVKKFPFLKISLDSYSHPVTLLGGDRNDYYSMYEEVLKGYNLREVSDISREIVQKTTESSSMVRTHYIAGATFTNTSVTAWFNGDPYHSPPLALGLVLNALFKKHLGRDKSINFANYPLPLTTEAQLNTFDGKTGFPVAFAVGFAMMCVTSVYILFYVRERVCKAKQMQFTFGVNPFVFWGVSFLFDFVVYLIAVCVILFTILILEGKIEQLSGLLVLLIFFGFFILPFIYILSHFFQVPFSAYIAVLIIGFLTGFIGIMVKELKHDISKSIDCILIFTPFYLLMSGIMILSNTHNLRKICLKFESLEIACQENNICCGLDNSYSLDRHRGIGRHLSIAFGMGILLFFILLWKEYCLRCFDTCAIHDKSPDYKLTLDNDVEEENNKIRTSDHFDQTYMVVLCDVTKRYKKVFAVNGICLRVKPSECFGLLGPDGAGKTTTIRMISGDLTIPYGDIYINGLSFDPLLEELTPEETLEMVALLRGVPSSTSKDLVKEVAREFGFSDFLKVRVEQLPPGTRRKLSIALSVIGGPLVIFLDEPTTGMDPASKSSIWGALAKLRDSGKCIILSSQSVEECEALCTRMAIMVNGNFQCLGSSQTLREKFAQGYNLTLKIAKTDNLDKDVADADDFMKRYFPGAVLKDRYQEILKYHLDEDLVPEMFGVMEEKKVMMNVEEYSVEPYSLQKVFLSFMQEQK